MQYWPNTKIPALTYSEFVPHIMTAENFRLSKFRGNIKVSCTGGNGRVILIEFDSLPRKYRDAVIARYGEPVTYMAIQPLRDLVTINEEARRFYAEYQLSDGRYLPLDYQMRYCRQADWLTAIDKALTNKRSTKEMLNISIDQLWANFSRLINNDEIEHGLPTSLNRLRDRYRRFRDEGCAGLVEAWRFGNDFARKVSAKIENLVVSLYCMPHQPYMNEVCKLYGDFMNGKLQVVDVHPEGGGELFNPEEFYVKGQRYVLGESTVDYYLKQEGNQAVINSLRMKKQDYGAIYRPSVKRLNAAYAMSKLTMDDIDLPFKGPDGDRVVKSYQVYDCCSQAIVGVSFSKDKDMELIMECMRDMFRLIIRKGWGMPWEIEMERHLTTHMGIFTPGAVFPATRICQSAQAKRAEGFIKKKKYGFQKKRPGFQGRFYAKLLTNRLNTDQKQLRFMYEEIVNNELADIEAYNNELHPKQDLYPGLTRWQVLEQNQNPNLPKFQAHQVIQHVGFSTATSIKAGKVQVQYEEYMLPDMNLITTTSYNGKIMAYYMPDENGAVNSVYLFETYGDTQEARFICEAKKKMAWQEAVIEQTDEDIAIRNRQWGQQAQFDSLVRTGRQQLIPVAVTSLVPARKAIIKPEIVRAVPAMEETTDMVMVHEQIQASKTRANAMF